MGGIRQPKPVLLFIGMLVADLPILDEVSKSLEAKFGPIELASKLIDFNFTTYYEPELGMGLKRQFLGFRNLVPPEMLPEVKLWTNALEDSRRVAEKRLFNLDPGYLTPARLVLASTKDFAHRLYLGHGIYGEVTLLFQKGKFESLPWTYPDYRSQEYQEFFLELRRLYMAQLKSLAG